MKRYWKLFVVVLLVGAATPFIWLSYFVVANEAPILEGEVIYGEEYKPGLSLDLYTPTVRVHERFPVVMFIHGGAWIGGSKEGLNMNRYNEAVNELRDLGHAVVSIDYTLARPDQSPFPECIQDAADAVAWIVQHADTFNLDTLNIGLFGESAGAHIAMMVAYAEPSVYGSRHRFPAFRYVVSVYGPNRLRGLFEMPTADSIYSFLEELPEPISSRLDLTQYIFGFDPHADSVRAYTLLDTYSPFNYVGRQAPPTLFVHGDEDFIVPVDQTHRLAQRLDSLSVDHAVHILEGMNHGFVDATNEQKSDAQSWIVDFIKHHHESADQAL